MTQIAQGAHVYIFPEPGQVYRVQADDVATVQVIYGAPSAVITLTAQAQTFGPYDAPAKLKVSANTAAAEYTLLRAHYAELTAEQIAGGAVGVLGSNNAGGAIEPDGDVPSLGGAVTADAIADALDVAPPADLVRIQDLVSEPGHDFGATQESLLSAIMAAGAGCYIRLKSGTIYTIDKSIKLLVDQILDLNGATLRRANQVSTTTTTTITSGVTSSIVVASTVGFSVGDTIVVIGGTVGLQYSKPTVIQSIVGNTITLAATLQVGSSSVTAEGLVLTGPTDTSWVLTGATKVYKSFFLVDATLAKEVKNGTIDGNRTNNPDCRWDSTAEILRWGCAVNRVAIKNFPGEAILDFGQGGVTAVFAGRTKAQETTYCQILDGNGNGIHLSSAYGHVITGNHGARLNEEIVTGHVNGFIAGSFGGYEAIISGNNAERCYAFMTPTNIQSEARVRVFANNARDMQRYGVAIISPTAPYLVENAWFHDNSFINCGSIEFSNGASNPKSGASFSRNDVIGAMLISSNFGGALDFNKVTNRYYTPSTTTSALAAGSMALTVASAIYAVGDKIRLAHQGAVSRPSVVSAVSGLNVTVTDGFEESYPSGSVVYLDDVHLCIPSGGGAMAAADTTHTMLDTSRIFRHQWISFFNPANGQQTNPLRVTSVNHTTKVVTFDGQLGRAWAAGTFVAAPGFGGGNKTAVQLTAYTGKFRFNEVTWGYKGVTLFGDCTGAEVKFNTISNYGSYGIQTSDAVISKEQVTDNTVNAMAGVTPSWGVGIHKNGSARVLRNTINHTTSQTTSGGGLGINVVTSTGIVSDNIVNTPNCGSITAQAGTSGNQILRNYCSGAVVDLGTNTVSGTTAI